MHLPRNPSYNLYSLKCPQTKNDLLSVGNKLRKNQPDELYMRGVVRTVYDNGGTSELQIMRFYIRQNGGYDKLNVMSLKAEGFGKGKYIYIQYLNC